MALIQITDKRYKAATMLEALVAMVIILGAFVTACMIYVNVTTADNSRQKLNAELLINELLMKTRKEKTYVDEKIETGSIIIEKIITKYPNAENLNQLSIKAVNKEGKTITTYDELLIDNLQK